MMDSSKTKQKGVDPNSINPSFFALEISPTMFVSRESLDLGEFENQKNFDF